MTTLISILRGCSQDTYETKVDYIFLSVNKPHHGPEEAALAKVGFAPASTVP